MYAEASCESSYLSHVASYVLFITQYRVQAFNIDADRTTVSLKKKNGNCRFCISSFLIAAASSAFMAARLANRTDAV